MVKKKKSTKKAGKKLTKKNKKKNISVARKKTILAKKKERKTARGTTSSEKRDLWNKNMILAGIVILLIILNAWFFLYKNQTKKGIKETKRPAGVDSAVTQEAGKNQKDEAMDEAVQELLLQRELEQWKTYKNTAYGFTIKYPDGWADPVVVKREGEAKYQFKVSFRNSTESDSQKGFDILIYKSLKKNGNLEPEYTDNLSIKDTAAPDFSNCLEPDVNDVGPNKYPAIEVAALEDDPCFSEAYFLSLQKNSYIYDLVPFPEGGIGYPGYDGEEKTAETLPEFTKALSTFELLTITPRKTTVVPRITAPKPVAEVKVVGGKRVCAKKNDKPRKSKQNKSKHMDMECCLDPDEYPNPWCTY